MPSTLHRDSWDQYAAICEHEIAALKAEIERLQKENADLRALCLGAAEHAMDRGATIVIDEQERTRVDRQTAE